METLPRVGIDFRWLDGLSLCNGQYRYAVDLISGLAKLRPEMRFVVLGSRPRPVEELADVFSDSQRWEYRYIPRVTGRGWIYREQWNYFRMLRHVRLATDWRDKPEPLHIDLFHALHTFVPIFAPVPVVETVYDLMPELFPEYDRIVKSREYRLHKWAFRRFVARAIAISATTANDLLRLWRFPAERTDIVYLGAKASDLSRQSRRDGVPIVLAPYNLEPRKNLLRLVEAAALLKRSGTLFRLVLFGRAAVNEQREREFRSKIHQFGLERCIQLTGRVSDEELRKLYQSAEVFVFPSLYEGFGLPVLEAMSAGARMVAHRESAMAEVVADAGWLIDMRSAEAICGAVLAAMNSPQMAVRAAARARWFSRQRMARETAAVYQKLLATAVCHVSDLRYSEEVYAGAGNRLPGSVAEHLGSD